MIYQKFDKFFTELEHGQQSKNNLAGQAKTAPRSHRSSDDLLNNLRNGQWPLENPANSVNRS